MSASTGSLFIRFAVLAFMLANSMPQSRVMAQAPDWMFALEGAYIGRLDLPDSNSPTGKSSLDARLDGRRNLAEDGFVLQWMVEEGDAVDETLTTWNWADGRVCETSIVDFRPMEVRWLVERTTDHAVVLRRGGEWKGKAMLFERTIERLPGQLRISDRRNDGNGTWLFESDFVLEETKPQTGKH